MSDIKVVLKQTVLEGSAQPDLLQRVATVYLDGSEYRISAPPEAKGDALDWVSHFTVRQLVDFGSEIEIHDAIGVLALRATQEELEKGKRASKRALGAHPDGVHCSAQICLNGHVQHCDGASFESNVHCTRCGAPCIDECPRCKEPIRGADKYKPVDMYSRPQFCHACGRPYPWMEDRLNTARELLDHDDKLSLDDRKNLWGDLQYVMSDPRADLVPAKKKLIGIRLEKATEYVREAILDLIAKATAEVLKG
ncbi:MAG: DUF2321 domain-containing protein [Acidobacteriia bacterium]|nr:DUF2321 domain-containing protein [Terriglobia bacterium]